MFHHWLLTCKILLMRLLLDMISAELYRLCHGRVQVTFHIHPLGGEHGPTDYIHNVVLPCCRVLHQSCTRAFIIIFTWESTESCIWSTIIPAQVLVLKRRDMICIDTQVWNISTEPWSYKEENVDFRKESFRVLHVELIEKFERSVTSSTCLGWCCTTITELALLLFCSWRKKNSYWKWSFMKLE